MRDKGETEEVQRRDRRGTEKRQRSDRKQTRGPNRCTKGAQGGAKIRSKLVEKLRPRGSKHEAQNNAELAPKRKQQ